MNLNNLKSPEMTNFLLMMINDGKKHSQLNQLIPHLHTAINTHNKQQEITKLKAQKTHMMYMIDWLSRCDLHIANRYQQMCDTKKRLSLINHALCQLTR